MEEWGLLDFFSVVFGCFGYVDYVDLVVVVQVYVWVPFRMSWVGSVGFCDGGDVEDVYCAFARHIAQYHFYYVA